MLQNKNVEVFYKDSKTCYKYHDTIVCEVHDDFVMLYTGGYYTRSTKTLINEILQLHDISWTVQQIKYQWYCILDSFPKKRKIKFEEGIKLKIK